MKFFIFILTIIIIAILTAVVKKYFFANLTLIQNIIFYCFEILIVVVCLWVYKRYSKNE